MFTKETKERCLVNAGCGPSDEPFSILCFLRPPWGYWSNEQHMVHESIFEIYGTLLKDLLRIGRTSTRSAVYVPCTRLTSPHLTRGSFLWHQSLFRVAN